MHSLRLFTTLIGCLAWASVARAQHQTSTVTPILFNNPLPYDISVTPYNFGAADLPTLHSYAAGEHDGKWVLIAGRTNGLHGFDRNSVNNFPVQFQNREVWVIDPATKQSWRRSLVGDPGLSEYQLNALTPTNNQFYQKGDHLYMTGGYGVRTTVNGTPDFGTFDTLSAIDLPGIVDWVQNGAGNASDHIRMIQNPIFKVTGGAMYEMGDRSHLVFGQDFDGLYAPNSNGVYTNQVRSFDIVDDGVNLAIANASSTAPRPEFRRRDLNIYPTIRDAGGSFEEGLTVLSGVFANNFGAWTVPVEVDANGNPDQADNGLDPLNAGGALDNDPTVFKQGFNGYHAAKVGLFSKQSSQMHEILFGGISLQTYDAANNQIITDNGLPFVNDITSVVVDANGQYSQHWLGEFPALFDQEGKRLRFGANAEFFPVPGLDQFDNGVIDLDSITQPTVIGYIFGGITANGPHTRGNPGVRSAASNQIFEVLLTPAAVPEPGSITLGLVALSLAAASRRRRRQAPRNDN